MQNIYLTFLEKNISTKLYPKLGLVLMCGVWKTSEERRHKITRHVMMPGEARDILF